MSLRRLCRPGFTGTLSAQTTPTDSRGPSGTATMSPSADADAIHFASADVAAQLIRWRAHLASERRMSPKTVEAYERDVRQFLTFLTEHLGEAVSLQSLGAIEPRDVR